MHYSFGITPPRKTLKPKKSGNLIIEEEQIQYLRDTEQIIETEFGA